MVIGRIQLGDGRSFEPYLDPHFSSHSAENFTQICNTQILGPFMAPKPIYVIKIPILFLLIIYFCSFEEQIVE